MAKFEDLKPSVVMHGVKRYRRGEPLSAIAKLWGLTVATVRKHLMNCGVKMRPKRRVKGGKFDRRLSRKLDEQTVSMIRQIGVKTVAAALELESSIVRRWVNQGRCPHPSTLKKLQQYLASQHPRK